MIVQVWLKPESSKSPFAGYARQRTRRFSLLTHLSAMVVLIFSVSCVVCSPFFMLHMVFDNFKRHIM